MVSELIKQMENLLEIRFNFCAFMNCMELKLYPCNAGQTKPNQNITKELDILVLSLSHD